MGDGIEADIARGTQEVQHIIVDVPDLRHVPLGAFADRESKLVAHQPVQALQAPQRDSLRLPDQAVAQIGIILPVGRLFPNFQDQLPPIESVRLVIQSRQGAVAKADQPGIEIPLVALLAQGSKT